MAHLAVENGVPYSVMPLVLADEDARPLLVPLIKGTFVLKGDGGPLEPADLQEPVLSEGQFWGDPGRSSYKYEPETAFCKQGTDVILIAHAQAPTTRTTRVDVDLDVGPVHKRVRVTGTRRWVKGLGGVTATEAASFEKIPLVWERAFGGWDRRDSNPTRHAFEPRNPVGSGFRLRGGAFEEGVHLPNLEDPNEPLKDYGQTVKPAGFGFVSPDWHPRAPLAGTYDAAWMTERMPLLPADFDRRFFNAAPADQIVPGYLRGDEEVSITNVTPSGRLSFRLPGVPPPECDVELRGGRREVLRTNLDTVIINTVESLVFLLWRAHLAVRDGPHGVHAIRVAIPDAGDAALAS